MYSFCVFEVGDQMISLPFQLLLVLPLFLSCTDSARDDFSAYPVSTLLNPACSVVLYDLPKGVIQVQHTVHHLVIFFHFEKFITIRKSPQFPSESGAGKWRPPGPSASILHCDDQEWKPQPGWCKRSDPKPVGLRHCSGRWSSRKPGVCPTNVVSVNLVTGCPNRPGVGMMKKKKNP